MNEAERTVLGAQIQRRREQAFETKRAAYAAAGVNPATWDRAEAGEPVRPDRLRRIVRLLWPESEGDWGRIGAATPASDADRVAELERQVAVLRAQLDLVARAADVPRDALERLHHKANREAVERVRAAVRDRGAGQPGTPEATPEPTPRASGD